MKTTFICLANSRKHGGRCVAGLRTDPIGWVRLVGRDPTGTLSPRHYTLSNGGEASLLDLIEVEISSACPQPHQPENLVVGREGWGIVDWIVGPPRWKLISRIDESEASSRLAPALATGPSLLGNQSDRISYDHFKKNAATASLALVEPSDVSWIINEAYRGNRIERRTRVRFGFCGKRYNLSVTDPQWERRLGYLPYGTYPQKVAGVSSDQRLFFAVSLSEPFQGVCFKLVAGVIVLPGTGRCPKLGTAQKRSGRPRKIGEGR